MNEILYTERKYWFGSSNTQAEQIGQIWWQVISSDHKAEKETEGEKLDKEGRSLVWVSGEHARKLQAGTKMCQAERLMHAAGSLTEHCKLGSR